MKIIQLTAENVKKLKIVDITPNGNLVQVTGKNGSGKTSVLDSIWWALSGAGSIQDEPVHRGEEKARIRLNLGELIVERTFTAAGTTAIKVYDPTGSPAGTPDKKLPEKRSPQEVLDSLMGELSFDPLAFSRMKPKEQLAELQRIADVTIDFDALKSANDADFEARTKINRDAKSKRTQAEAITIPADLPAKPIDESGLLDELQKAAEHNTTIETRKANREQARRDAVDKHAEASRLQSQAEALREQARVRAGELRRQLEEYERDSEAKAKAIDEQSRVTTEAADALGKKLANAEDLPTPIDLNDLRSKLNTAKTTNAAIAQRQQRDKILAEAIALEKQSQQLTDQMAAREKQKTDAIKAAKMPVDGLGFGAGFVTYNGLPFSQASDAEALRVSVAIAMATNAKLRVIRIRDGSLLDEDGMKLLATLAREKDYQVWIERVDSSGEVGIVMEEGQVKAVHQEVAQ